MTREPAGDKIMPLVRSARQSDQELLVLPPRYEAFVGREEEIQTLVHFLTRRDEPGIVQVSGVPGVGKTALVVEAGYRVTASYPQGVLFLPVGGAATREVMSRAILNLAPTARIPDREHELSSLYLDVFTGKRVLLIFDDVRDQDQALALALPPPQRPS